MFRVLFICIVPTVLGIIVKDPPPSPNDYKYSYNIEDPTTGDSKSQHEVRQGDVVTGAYTVVGPDGTKRTVEYTADAQHGFQATIREDPVSQPLVTHDYNTIKYETPVYTSVAAHAPRTNYVAAKPVVHYALQNDQLVVQYAPQNDKPVVHYAVQNDQPVVQYAPQNDEQVVYFTPQNKIEPRAPFDGQYFIPANDKY